MHFLINDKSIIFTSFDKNNPKAVECKINDMNFCSADCPYFSIHKTKMFGSDREILTVIDCEKTYSIPGSDLVDMRKK